MAEKPDFMPVHPTPRWLGEPAVLQLLEGVLRDVVAEHGDEAKAVAWDVNYFFKKRLAEMPL